MYFREVGGGAGEDLQLCLARAHQQLLRSALEGCALRLRGGLRGLQRGLSHRLLQGRGGRGVGVGGPPGLGPGGPEVRNARYLSVTMEMEGEIGRVWLYNVFVQPGKG